jgi:uncharacterized protein YndB with AHSA1/START domain
MESLSTIQHVLTVPLSAEPAFALFVHKLMAWWPREYTWSNDVLELIAIEPVLGGRCFERGPQRFEVDWGRVLVWEPPARLVFTWQISPRREPEPNPAKASEVEVRFHPRAANTTEVSFEHRLIDRHGAGSAEYHTALSTPQGWPYILGRYQAQAEAAGTE